MMLKNDLIEKIVDSILQNNFRKYFNFPHTDDITNQVRTELEKLSIKDQELVKNNMESYLSETIQNETDDFIIKENIIYYLGRGNNVNYPLLRKIYFEESNPHLRLNLFFSLLPSFDEEIEFDFIKGITPGNEYDNLIRSWTMAFFANAENPYEYKDNRNDSPAKAISARLKRFAILSDKNNNKYLKALSYLLIDLTVVWLFVNNRGSQILSDEDYKTMESIPEDYEEFSKYKNEEIVKVKNKIIKRK